MISPERDMIYLVDNPSQMYLENLHDLINGNYIFYPILFNLEEELNNMVYLACNVGDGEGWWSNMM